MGLFSKETCVVCQTEKTGLLDKKCMDGKVCKSCVKKASKWFDNYKNSTAQDLQSHLSKREADLRTIGDYNFTKVFGEFGVILLDTEKRCFAALPDTSSSLFGSQRKVTSINDILDLQPDIFSFDEVKDFEIDITETSREEKKTENGNQVSYNPPHYLYMISFTLRLKLDNKYLPAIYIPLNSGTVQIKNIGRRIWTDPGKKLAAHLLGLPGLILENQAAVYNNDSLLDLFYHSPYEMPESSYGFKCTLENWNDIKKYHYYLAMSHEIQEIITGKGN